MLGLRLHNYAIKRLLGEGGMSSVYEAEHVLIRHSVAVKVLKSELSADGAQVQRFFNEARATSAIRHPNIVEVVDVGRLPDGVPYLVMELLEGECLSDRLERLGVLDIPLALDFAHQAANALVAAHALSVVHRDLKPDNLFIVPDQRLADRELIKVLDFGIAKLRGELAPEPFDTMVGTVLGTPPYMSPEQCRGLPHEIDERTDIYALGIILYEMLCGRPPFVADGAGELMLMHMADPPDPPTRWRPEIGPQIEAVILRALAKRSEDRFATMAEFDAALIQISASLGMQPSAAQRPTPSVVSGAFSAPAVERTPAVTRALSRRAAVDGDSGVVALAPFADTPAVASGVPAADLAVAESELEPEVEVALDDDSLVAPTPPSNAGAARSEWIATAVGAAAVAALLSLMVVAANRSAPASETSTSAASRATPPAGPAQVQTSRPAVAESSPIATTAASQPIADDAPSAEAAPLVAAAKPSPAAGRGQRRRLAPAEHDSAARRRAFALSSKSSTPRAEPRTAEPEATPVAPQEPGYLSFDSAPWSDVFLGSDRLGTTPLIRVPLPPGKHLLTLRNPELGASTSYAVEIQAGKTLSRLVGWDRR